VKLVFSDQALEDHQYWIEIDKTALMRINELIQHTERSPFEGFGKPEPLEGVLSGWRSRRISRENRMVYRIMGSGRKRSLEFAQLIFHY